MPNGNLVSRKSYSKNHWKNKESTDFLGCVKFVNFLNIAFFSSVWKRMYKRELIFRNSPDANVRSFSDERDLYRKLLTHRNGGKWIQPEVTAREQSESLMQTDAIGGARRRPGWLKDPGSEEEIASGANLGLISGEMTSSPQAQRMQLKALWPTKCWENND